MTTGRRIAATYTLLVLLAVLIGPKTYADELAEQRTKLEGTALLGDCVPSASPDATWNCAIGEDGNGNHQRIETCPNGDRFPIDVEFLKIADAESANRALEELVMLKLKNSGLRTAIRWFACQGIFVQMDDWVSGDRKNPTHALTRLSLTILTNEKHHPDWAAEVAKWDDLQVKEKLWFFSISSLPTQVGIEVTFSLSGRVQDVHNSVSGK